MKVRSISARSVLLMIILISGASCSQEIGRPSTETPMRDTDVSLAEANEAASNLYKSDAFKATGSSLHGVASHTGPKAILNTITAAEAGVPSFYIVNYVDGGWAVIAGDKRVEPVLAYSEEGKLESGSNIPGGLGTWLLNTHDKMQVLKQRGLKANVGAAATSGSSVATKIVPSCVAVSAWAKVSVQQVQPDCVAVGGGGGCQDQYSATSVGPLLNTLWDQGCGFNNFAPACNNPGYCDRAPTGCVATAMAQIMYYWKQPTTYDWASMNPNYGTPEAARLMYDAAAGNGYYSWGCGGSGVNCGTSATCDGGVTGQFKGKFGYSSADHGGYNFNTLVANLNAGQPVMLGAYRDENCFLGICWPIYTGHSWVADGYQITNSFDCATGTSWQSKMIHMNWGWGSGYNAWVAEDNWAVNVDFNDGGGIKNFNYFRDMYSNIRP